MKPFAFVLFGATGDLARLKIWPAIFDLCHRDLLPEEVVFIGNGRSEHTNETFREYVRGVVDKQHDADTKHLQRLLRQIYYVRGDLADEQTYADIGVKLEELTKKGERCENRIMHLAIAPKMYQPVVKQIGRAGLHESKSGWTRILVEKPFGNNLESAQELDKVLSRYFKEGQIFRIDHYLGKESVLNMLAFRFANRVFEPLWNKQYVDSIQIQLLEEFGIKDRGHYYDHTGAVRDVVQNHILQLLAITTMEEPAFMSKEHVRRRRREILRSLKHWTPKIVREEVVRGQYKGYLDEKDVKEKSRTETFVALKTYVQNKRWQGVPIYLKTGKSLARTVTEISVVFKSQQGRTPNVLNLRIAPNEGIVWRFMVKKPGHEMELEEASMQFCYRDVKGKLMNPYERLLFDSFKGEQMLFTMASGVEAEWQFVDPIMKAFDTNAVKLFHYDPGSWGPGGADRLIERDGRHWLEPSLDVCPI